MALVNDHSHLSAIIRVHTWLSLSGRSPGWVGINLVLLLLFIVRLLLLCLVISDGRHGARTYHLKVDMLSWCIINLPWNLC